MIEYSPQQPPSPLPRDPELSAIGERLISIASSIPVDLIPAAQIETHRSLRERMGEGALCICDFYIEGAEKWEWSVGGFYNERFDILNIDHHAPHPSMYRPVSSGNLAAAFVRKFGEFPERIVVNHTDCDSVISRLIMGGEIPPHPQFEQAVIAADHTGEANQIADLLQALDPLRDLPYSARNLGLLLSGAPLDEQAQRLVERRLRGREETAAFVARSEIEYHGKLAVVYFEETTRSEFLPALIPDAAVIVMVEPGNAKTENRPIIRIRRGNAAPEAFTLFDLDINQVDPSFGGRWNAGSNKRGGGSPVEPSQYIDTLAQNLDRYMAG